MLPTIPTLTIDDAVIAVVASDEAADLAGQELSHAHLTTPGGAHGLASHRQPEIHEHAERLGLEMAAGARDPHASAHAPGEV